MSPIFSWCNFIINAMHLASGAPSGCICFRANKITALGHFVNHITGHNYVMVDTTDDNVQTNQGQDEASANFPGLIPHSFILLYHESIIREGATAAT